MTAANHCSHNLELSTNQKRSHDPNNAYILLSTFNFEINLFKVNVIPASNLLIRKIHTRPHNKYIHVFSCVYGWLFSKLKSIEMKCVVFQRNELIHTVCVERDEFSLCCIFVLQNDSRQITKPYLMHSNRLYNVNDICTYKYGFSVAIVTIEMLIPTLLIPHFQNNQHFWIRWRRYCFEFNLFSSISFWDLLKYIIICCQTIYTNLSPSAKIFQWKVTFISMKSDFYLTISITLWSCCRISSYAIQTIPYLLSIFEMKYTDSLAQK